VRLNAFFSVFFRNSASSESDAKEVVARQSGASLKMKNAWGAHGLSHSHFANYVTGSAERMILKI
jgi:hypothetical protein